MTMAKATRGQRILAVVGMDKERPLVWVGVEPSSGPTRSSLRRITMLSLQVKGLTLAQFPNASLTVGFLAGTVGGSAHGSWQSVARFIALGAMAFWGYEELVHGVNWFRHLLGIHALVGIIVGLATRLWP